MRRTRMFRKLAKESYGNIVVIKVKKNLYPAANDPRYNIVPEKISFFEGRWTLFYKNVENNNEMSVSMSNITEWFEVPNEDIQYIKCTKHFD